MLICDIIFLQVVFEGLKQQSQPTIEIDDISFSKEICNKTARELPLLVQLVLVSSSLIITCIT